MTEIPQQLDTDEEHAQFRDVLKTLGYGHYSTNYSGGSAMSMKRGVRISWSVTSTQIQTSGLPVGHKLTARIDRFYIEVRRGKTVNHWTAAGAVKKTITDYERITEFSTANACLQAVFAEAIEAANSCVGDKAITVASLKKGILQNTIFEDLQQKLREHFSSWLTSAGLEFAFLSRAIDAKAPAIFKISALGHELRLFLSDGQISIEFGNEYDGRAYNIECRKINVSIPAFADPSFDPELLFVFARQATNKLLVLKDMLTQKEAEITEIRKSECHLRNAFRGDVESAWQNAWYTGETR